MVGKLVGIKKVSGKSRRTGNEFSFSSACIVTDMSEKDVANGSKGNDVHTPVIPERLESLLTDSAIGSDIEVDFYFANGRENIGYCNIIPPKK